MAKQTINIGTVANDGTGDALRDAFDKVNDNFDELYAVPEEVVGGKITIASTAPGSPATGDVWIDTT